jgi:hypothetical protein
MAHVYIFLQNFKDQIPLKDFFETHSWIYAEQKGTTKKW